jgi:hypothetical protein
MPDADVAGAELCAERARRAIADTAFPGVGNLTTSIGVCALDDADNGQQLFRQADLALYWAKSGGRNAVMRYSPEDVKRQSVMAGPSTPEIELPVFVASHAAAEEARLARRRSRPAAVASPASPAAQPH